MAAVATPLPGLAVVPGTRRRRRRARQVRRLVNVATTSGLLLLTVAWMFTLRPQSLGGPAGYVMVRGVSMEPTFDGGDLVIVRPVDSYRVGDVIAYRVHTDGADDVIVIHRIIGGTTVDGLIVQGDNNASPDDWHPKQADIVGKAWLQLPHGGLVLSFLHAPLPLASLAMGITVAVVLVPSKERPVTRPRRWRER
jgi:signal peptidase I